MGKKGKKGKGKGQGQKTPADEGKGTGASSVQPGPSQQVPPAAVPRPSQQPLSEAAAPKPSKQPQQSPPFEAEAPKPAWGQRQPTPHEAAAAAGPSRQPSAPEPAAPKPSKQPQQSPPSEAAAPRPARGQRQPTPPEAAAAGPLRQQSAPEAAAPKPSQLPRQSPPSEASAPGPWRKSPPSEAASPKPSQQMQPQVVTPQVVTPDTRGTGQPQQMARPKGDGKKAVPASQGQAPPPADTAGLVKALEMLKYPTAPRLRTVRDKEFPEKQIGTGGRVIRLIANYFAVDIPHGYVYHYDVDIRPFKESKASPKGSKPAPDPKQPTRRRFPARLCRTIIDMMVRQYQNTLRCYPAYDGNKNMYTREPLPGIKSATNFNVSIQENGREVQFIVVIKPVIKDAMGGTNQVSLEPLHSLARGQSAEIFEEAVLALDIILRYGPSLRFVPVSRSFFMKPRSTDEVPLGEGREIWFGYYQSLRPGWKPFDNTTSFYVNIDKVATAFYKAQPILAHIMEVLHLQSLPQRFNDSQIKFLSKELKNLKVEVTHLPYRRKHVIVSVTRDSANKITFKDDNGQVTDTASYFRVKYRALKYPQYPCLQVKPENRNICIPLEVCELADQQPVNRILSSSQTAEMVKKCAVPPQRRFAEIDRMAKLMKDNSRDYLKQFDVDMSLKPLKLEARVMDPPNVEFGSQQVTRPREGQWEVNRSGFTKGAVVKNWIILNFCRFPGEQDLWKLAKDIQIACNKNGMTMDNVQAVHMFTGRTAEVLLEVQQRYKQLQLMVVILRKQDIMYKHIKKVSETAMGVPTQCLTDENAGKCRDQKFSHRYILNLCLKINAKMGGTNSRLPSEFKPPMFNKPIMIIGADVSHPAPGGEEKYSIASAAGSMDGGPAQYMATVELQKIKSEVRAREERILNLQVMIVRLLKEFGNRTGGKLPEVLIYYRDGVSEGQFGPVRDYEIVQIRRACTEIKAGYEPKITFIIVQKRHHTRFIPENLDRDGVGRMKNVPPGTIVDTEITHPSFFDWFLCSHLGIQGTSRPAHYSVVWDDSDFNANTLQKLSFYLCHTNTRCTKSVSIPPPVVYADLMAFRAKLYINSERESAGESSSSSATSGSDGGIIPTNVEEAIKLSDKIKNVMFFV